MDKKNRMGQGQYDNIKFSLYRPDKEGAAGQGGAPGVISKWSRVTDKLQFDTNKTPL